jgi:predicted amidohydrolase YtcJ
MKGVIVTPEEALYRITVQSLKFGFQVAAHAIGDLANRITLKAYQRALKEVARVKDHRLRLEHAQVVALEDIDKFAPLGIVLSMQPPHCTSDMPRAETRVGPDLIKGAYTRRSFLNTGMLADFIILSDNILTVSSKKLLSMKVEKTYVGGNLVYKKRL